MTFIKIFSKIASLMLFCLGFTAQIHAQALVKGTPAAGQTASIVNEVSGKIGIGTTAPQKRLHIVSTGTNDGIQIDQTGTSGAGLYLNNTAAGGRNWGVFSSGSANTNLGGAGNFSIFDMNLLQNRFFIQGTTGNVGIGTATPTLGLTVNNGGFLLSNPANPGRDYRISTNASQQVVATNDLTTSTGGNKLFVVGTGSTNKNFMVASTTTNNIHFMVNGTNGNVGIGTASPSGTLHVSNPNPFAGQDPTTLQVSALSNPMIKLSSIASGTTAAATLAVGIATCNGCFSTQAKIGDATIKLENSNNLIFNTNTSGGTGGERSFIFGAQDKIAMTIWNGGRVAIGNNIPFSLTNANHLLFVEKGILTEKVTVAVKNTVDWADYVFADNYPLSKLADVEAFVKKNKHLPNVPSAQEMMTQGLDVAKMDAKLLEKIEELTLYLIELKKENDAIKIQIQSLIKNGK